VSLCKDGLCLHSIFAKPTGTHISLNSALLLRFRRLLVCKVFGGVSFGGRCPVACCHIVRFHVPSICSSKACQDLLFASLCVRAPGCLQGPLGIRCQEPLQCLCLPYLTALVRVCTNNAWPLDPSSGNLLSAAVQESWGTKTVARCHGALVL